MYAAHLRPYQYTPLFSFKTAPSSVHPEHCKLDQHHRLTRQREVRQLARPQLALRQYQRQHVEHYARAEQPVRQECREPKRQACQ
jgi:hypothetical protein